MKTPINIVATGWNISDPEFHKLVGFSTKESILKELNRIGCPLRAGRYVNANEFWESMPANGISSPVHTGKSIESKSLLE